MKKVLITATTYPLHAQDTQPRFIHDLAKSLQGVEHVTVLVPRAPGTPKSDIVEGIQVLRYPYFFNRWETLAYGGGILENLKRAPIKLGLIPFLFISQFIFLFLHTRKHHYDIIHAHWIIPQGLVVVLLKKLTSRPFRVVVTSHGGDLYALQGKVLNYIKRWIVENADAPVVVSRAMRTYCYDRIGVKTNKIIHIRSMGVDLIHKFTNSRSQQERQGLIFVGRIAEKKGVHTLIEAISILNKRQFPIPLTIVGSGPELESVQQRTQDLNIDNLVKFTGSLPNNQIPEQLNRHKLFIMPSIVAKSGDQEGLGLVAVEAMGCGCAVIASNLEAVNDVVENGVNGLMFNSGNAEALADTIRNLLSTPQLINQLAEAGRKSAILKYDWQQVAKDYREIYNNISPPD